MPAKQIYEFGEFRIDPDERLLLRDGKPVPLTPKAFETLLALVERSGHVVKKDDLMKRVWPDSFVEEVNLAQNVSAIRKALNGQGEQYIETVSKTGYRLIVKARIASEVAEEPPLLSQTAGTAAQTEVTLQAEPDGAPSRKKIRPVAIGVAAVTMLGLGWLVWRVSVRPASVAPIRSLAILPLTNLSGDPQQEYFVDGVTEALTTEVAKIARVEPLRVISRTTAMRYKNTSRAVPDIAGELRVDAVLEGAVVRSGDHVRITAQLIRAANDEHIWAQSYDRNLVDTLEVQGEIAQDIAKQIKIEIAPQEQARKAKRPPPSFEAQDLYLRGRYEWNKRTPQHLLRARALFQQSLDLDPNNALAWNGVAEAEYLLGSHGYDVMPPSETMPRAKAAAQRAIELDEDFAEAHASLAIITWSYDWNWPAAEREFKRALELNPNDAVSHQFYGIGLASQEHFEQSIAELKRAAELDPLSQPISVTLGRMLYFARRYEEAIAVCRKAVELDPNFMAGHEVLGLVALAAGRNDEALRELGRAHEMITDSTWALMNLGRAYARSGQRQAAWAALNELKQTAQHKYVPAYEFASLYAELGQMDTAFHWLDKAVEERPGTLMAIRVEPVLDALRADPRFAGVVRRIVPH